MIFAKYPLREKNDNHVKRWQQHMYSQIEFKIDN